MTSVKDEIVKKYLTLQGPLKGTGGPVRWLLRYIIFILLYTYGYYAIWFVLSVKKVEIFQFQFQDKSTKLLLNI